MKKVTILIVEDEILIAKDIKIQLESLGYDVCQIASTADEALRFVEIHHPDLIIMDINLDGPADGIEAAKKIRDKYDLPIIYLTDLRDNDTFERAKKTGPAVFLNKPFNEYELSRHVDLAIHNASGASLSDSKKDHLLIKDSVWIKDELSFKKIPIQDILWIEAAGSYCKVVTGSKEHLLSKSMREANDLILNPVFFKVHKSYIVNSEKIDEIKGSSLIISGKTIPIGKKFFQGFKEKLKLL